MSPLRLPWRRRAQPPGDLACQELVELVTDYLEGALPERDRARFEEHVSMCEGCAAYVEQLRQTLSVLGRLEPEDLSPEAERELLDAFRQWKREEQSDGPS
ncbi:MAG: zf-HC2 domain-containing protein [Solirubrobacterales bacterium]|nr:zf-HC2 domain-containing protein [Solirubrobacterales bacterium]